MKNSFPFSTAVAVTSYSILPVLSGILLLLTSCRKDIPSSVGIPEEEPLVTVQMLARVLGSADLGPDRCAEVHDAVSSSTDNGYDEEYTMQNLFECPGSGVGDDADAKSSARQYSRPLRDLIAESFAQVSKSGGDALSADRYVEYIASSDMQIYWPNSGDWDGSSAPVVTYIPDGEQQSNKGWYLDAEGRVCEVIVDEEMAAARPVWVLNYNEDAGYTTLEQYLRDNPEISGGDIVVKSSVVSAVAPGPLGAAAIIPGSLGAAAGSGDQVKTLVLKSFTMKRHYDSWFRGASEFFVKMGAVEDFKAKNEEDLALYSPKITDFMVVIKRKYLNVPYQLNTILVSDWTSQLENVAFMITEDDGGSRTSWKCSAVVKYNSKSFGFDIDLPYRSNDDIVWRGQLSRRFIESSDEVTGRFGDVELVFDFI